MEIVRVRPAELDFPMVMDRIVGSFVKRFGIREPRITVRYGSSLHSRGTAWRITRRITLRIGTDMKDAEHVLLHELSHLVPGSWSHDKSFYRTFKAVIKWAKFDAGYSVDRESRYKPRNSKTMITRRRNEST